MKEYTITLQGKDYEVLVKEISTKEAVVEVNGKEYRVGVVAKKPDQIAPLQVKPVRNAASTPPPVQPSLSAAREEGTVSSPLPGVIVSVNVKIGDAVKTGQTVAVLEAMKMENEVRATTNGTVTDILVKQGDSVTEGAPLVKIGG